MGRLSSKLNLMAKRSGCKVLATFDLVSRKALECVETEAGSRGPS